MHRTGLLENESFSWEKSDNILQLLRPKLPRQLIEAVYVRYAFMLMNTSLLIQLKTNRNRFSVSIPYFDQWQSATYCGSLDFSLGTQKNSKTCPPSCLGNRKLIKIFLRKVSFYRHPPRLTFS